MKRYFKYAGTLIICFFMVFITKVQGQSKPPNIVYILADDLGFGDVSVYNSQSKISTPNIDRLAKQGMRFTDAHTTSSVCTPSRYSLLTGRYPWRSRLPVGVLQGYSRTLIDDEQQTAASFLKSKTYTTAVIGKWHLGLDWVPKKEHEDSISLLNNTSKMYGISTEMKSEHIDFSRPPVKGPIQAGFDYSYILPASLDMPPYCYLQNQQLTTTLTGYTPGNSLQSNYTGPFWRAGLTAPDYDFHDVLPTFTQKATTFITSQATQKNPFFLYFPMPAPHTPWVPTASFKGTSQAGEYGDFVQMVDDAVGQVLNTLDKMGLSQNTIVIFSSDNGPYWRPDFEARFNHQAAGPFRGMKGDAFEGGHRVPFIVRYPGRVKAGSVSNATTTLANFMATIKDLLGDTNSAYKAEDSYSILPVLLGKTSVVASQPAIINMSSRGVVNIRKGAWKLIQQLGSGGFTTPAIIKAEAGGPAGQLYNIDNDPHEDHNLYLQNPQKVKELNDLFIRIKAAQKGKQFVL